jgi:hypothetical protein
VKKAVLRIRDGNSSDPGWKKVGSGINIPGLWIRIVLMRIQIRIQLKPLMRIRIHIRVGPAPAL